VSAVANNLADLLFVVAITMVVVHLITGHAHP
jgi:uncharacterized membrane protein YtjA (UPF0391 family)